MTTLPITMDGDRKFHVGPFGAADFDGLTVTIELRSVEEAREVALRLLGAAMEEGGEE